MKVETTPYVQSLIDAKKAVDAKSEEFSAELDRQLMNVLKHQETNKTEETSQEDAGVKTFKDEFALEERLHAYAEERKEQMTAKKELEKGPLSSLLST